MKFTTKDRDSDQKSNANCAVSYKGAWWYKHCHSSNLNGLYLEIGDISSTGISWHNWRNDWRSMKKTEMKICTGLL